MRQNPFPSFNPSKVILLGLHLLLSAPLFPTSPVLHDLPLNSSTRSPPPITSPLPAPLPLPPPPPICSSLSFLFSLKHVMFWMNNLWYGDVGIRGVVYPALPAAHLRNVKTQTLPVQKGRLSFHVCGCTIVWRLRLKSLHYLRAARPVYTRWFLLRFHRAKATTSDEIICKRCNKGSYLKTHNDGSNQALWPKHFGEGFFCTYFG